MSQEHTQSVKLFPNEINSKAGFRLHYTTLFAIVLGMNSQRVFEFGCGHSSKVILSALKQTGGKLITSELRNIEDTGNSSEMLDKEKHSWKFIQKPAQEVIQNDIKNEKFDVVLHDGAHEALTVLRDIRGIVRHMKKNSILSVHDTNHKSYPYLRWAIKIGLFPYRYEILNLPYGYGLTVIKIKSNKKNGEVEFQNKETSIT